MMEVATTRFGTVAVAEDEVWTFPQGLVGFEHLKRYVLLDSRKGASLQWLQALEDPSVAFLVCDPKVFLPSVEIRLPEGPVGRTEHPDYWSHLPHKPAFFEPQYPRPEKIFSFCTDSTALPDW